MRVGMVTVCAALALAASARAQAPNDDCLFPQTIAGYGAFAYDNRDATQDGPADCADGRGVPDTARDVWFRWVAPCSGLVLVSTCATSTSDDKLVVYHGGNCADLSDQQACDDDGCGIVGGPSTATFAAVSGEVYLIRIGVFPGAPGAQGTFEIVNVSVCVPGGFCPGDWNGNALVEVVDIFGFLTDWFNEENGAQEYGDVPGVPAIFAFLTDWFAAGIGPCS